jgi:hypothetical protein
MHLINLIEEELRAYRETGRAIHLAHSRERWTKLE